jgi:hypothetical protein
MDQKKKGDEGKNVSSTQVKEGERRKRFEVSEYLLQLIYEKLWEQVIHILDLVQIYLKFSPKYFILSTKIYY